MRRLVRLLSRPSTLITLAGASFLAADLVLIFVIGPIDFAFDFWCCYQQAGERAITDPSTLYVWSDTYTFRYTPLGALLFVPLVPLSERRRVGVDRHQAGGARRGREVVLAPVEWDRSLARASRRRDLPADRA